jgi:hypothetical protein
VAGANRRRRRWPPKSLAAFGRARVHAGTDGPAVRRGASGGRSDVRERYIFAELERGTLAPVPGHVALPERDPEAYAEPFASTGRWSHFGELRAARTLYSSPTALKVRHRTASNDDLTITAGADSLHPASGVSELPGLSFPRQRAGWGNGRGALVLRWQQNRADSSSRASSCSPAILVQRPPRGSFFRSKRPTGSPSIEERRQLPIRQVVLYCRTGSLEVLRCGQFHSRCRS